MATSRRVIASVNHTYARQGTRPMSQPDCDLVLSFVIDFDCALDNVLERRVLGREGHAKLQGATLHLTLSDDALDLPLRGDAHLLEELANLHVEAVLIHRGAVGNDVGIDCGAFSGGVRVAAQAARSMGGSVGFSAS